MAHGLLLYIKGLKRYWAMALSMAIFFLLLFVIVEAAHIPLLTDPSGWLKSYGLLSATIGIALLIVDVWLPVPSSTVMIAFGALFGVWLGALLSLIGSLGASLIGFGTGRMSNDLLKRLITAKEYEIAESLLKKWGVLAIIVTRPVPILAETVVILAGASSLRWSTVTLASILGILPAAFLYALAGATSASSLTGILLFVTVLGLAGVAWWVGRRVGRKGVGEKRSGGEGGKGSRGD